VGSLDSRIQRLEELYGLDEDPQEKARMQHRRAELRAKLDGIAAREGLDTEEEEMDPRRRKAIEDLNESFKRRREQRGALELRTETRARGGRGRRPYPAARRLRKNLRPAARHGADVSRSARRRARP
jgi:hypothetical protein